MLLSPPLPPLLQLVLWAVLWAVLAEVLAEGWLVWPTQRHTIGKHRETAWEKPQTTAKSSS